MTWKGKESWDDKWTWNHPDFYIFPVSYERLNGNCLHSEQSTGNIVSMALRCGEEEPLISSAQVDMPLPHVMFEIIATQGVREYIWVIRGC